MNKKNQIYVSFTVYQLLISIIYSFINRKKGVKSYLVLLIVNKSVLEYKYRLFDYKFFDAIIVFDSTFFKTEVSIKDVWKKYTQYPYYYYKEDDNFQRFEELVKNSEINIYSTKHSFSLYLLRKYKGNPIKLHEEGENIYYYQPMNLRNFLFFKLLYRYPFRAEATDTVKKIYVQNVQRLPAELQQKAVEVDYNKLISNLSDSEKKLIKDFFFKKYNFVKSRKKRFILLTQCLSEDKLIDEEYKIKLYKRIIDEFSNGYEIYIKSHPRELTNYKYHFNFEFHEIPNNFPSEVLNLINSVLFDRGVTLFSSALNSANFIKEKIFLGTDWDDKISKGLKKVAKQ